MLFGEESGNVLGKRIGKCTNREKIKELSRDFPWEIPTGTKLFPRMSFHQSVKLIRFRNVQMYLLVEASV